MHTPTWDDVAAAAATIAGLVDRTPVARSRTLSAICGCEIVVKFENLQFTGSFKDRGAANRLAALSLAERRAGVVAASAGNHAQGVAYHAARLGVPATILMPITAPLSKVANTMRLGATIVQHGATLAEAMERLPDLLAGGATLVHPYDDPLVVAGQGTAAVEFFADVADLGLPELDVLVVPVGGGGLLTGCALAANHLAPRCEVLGVQTESYPFLAAALRGGEFAATPVPAGLVSIADGIAVKQPGQIARAVLPGLGVGCVTVSEGRIEEAIGLLVEVEKTVAEGAGAAPLAAVLDDPERFAGRRVGLLLTGGNIDPRLLSSVLQRALVRQGRLTRLRVETDDLPGNLARIATVIGREGGNLIEVTHQRLLSGAPARRVDIDFLIETLDAAHLGRIRAALSANGDTAGELGLMEP